MNFSNLEKAALQLNDLYEQLEVKRWGRAWSAQELALGFMGDVGDLAKLIRLTPAFGRSMTTRRSSAMSCLIASGRSWCWPTNVESILRRSSSETHVRSQSTCHASWPSRRMPPNNAFKPKPLRSTKHMADTACHVLGSTTQLGLT